MINDEINLHDLPRPNEFMGLPIRFIMEEIQREEKVKDRPNSFYLAGRQVPDNWYIIKEEFVNKFGNMI